tara:strand:- start:3662 stop:4021 length:360 start_codon:yes stop_codon:yes gene_type:complete
MSKLIDVEKVGNRIFKTYKHVGEKGNNLVTTEITEDISPIYTNLKDVAQNRNNKSELRLKASIPFTVLDEECKKASLTWGISVKDAFSEITSCRSGRAKTIIKKLTEDIDYRRFQTKFY